MAYEYKVLPAPKAGLKARGKKTVEDRFANALETTMNILAAEGWEYQRTDTLPCEQREGLMGKTTVFQNMLVFRREAAEDAEMTVPLAITDETDSDIEPTTEIEEDEAAPALEDRPLTDDPARAEPPLTDDDKTVAAE